MTGIGVRIQAEWLPSAVNCLADRVSQLLRKENWRMTPAATSCELHRLLPDTDSFDETSSALRSQFSSTYLCPDTEATSALLQN